MKIHIDYGGDLKVRTKIKNAFGFKDRRLYTFYDYIYIKIEEGRKIIGGTNSNNFNSIPGYIHYIYDKKTNTLIPKHIIKGE